MPSFAEMMYQSGTQSAQNQGSGLADSVTKGAQLALQKEQNDLAAVKLAQDKKALGTAKYEKFVEALDKGVKYEGAAKTNYYTKILPQYRDALGLTDAFPDQTIDFTTKTPQNIARLQTIIARTRDPKDPLTEAEAIALINDPVAFADVTPEFRTEATQDLAKAATTKINAKAQMAALEAQNMRQDKEIASAGPKKVAEKTAEIYTAFQAAGGSAAMQTNIKKLEGAIEQLRTGKVKFGTAGKNLPYGTSDEVLARFDPDAKLLVDDVRGSANMRALLADPNPTAQQIAMIQNRMIDPRLSNAANIKKLSASLNTMKAELAGKESEFRKQGLIPAQPQQPPATRAPGQQPPPAPVAPQPTDLDNSSFAAKVAAFVGMDPAKQQAMAQKYNMPLSTFLQKIGIKQGAQ